MRYNSLHLTIIAVITGSLILFSNQSCREEKDKKQVLTSLRESLEYSTSIAWDHTEETVAFLRNESYAPFRYYKAGIWFPKAERVRKGTTDLCDYIDLLLLRADSGQTIDVSRSSELANKVDQYKDSMLVIDELICTEFESYFTNSFSRHYSNPPVSLDLGRLQNADTEEVPVLLSQLKNTVAIYGVQLTEFCKVQLGNYCGFFSSSILVSQSSSVLMPGQKFEIMAGVGSYSRIYQPKVFINGKPYKANDEGVVIRQIVTSGRPGKYQIPVRIEYTDEFGKPRVAEKTLEYLVSDIKQ